MLVIHIVYVLYCVQSRNVAIARVFFGRILVNISTDNYCFNYSYPLLVYIYCVTNNMIEM